MLPPEPKRPRRKKDRKGGRPRADDRRAFSAILWIARTASSWEKLPARFGSERTARRRLARWERTGALENMFGSYLLRSSDAEVLLWADAFQANRGRELTPWLWQLEWAYRSIPRAGIVAARQDAGPTAS